MKRVTWFRAEEDVVKYIESIAKTMKWTKSTTVNNILREAQDKKIGIA